MRKTAPIVPARIDFSSLEAAGRAFERARHQLLGGNRLPERWRGRRRFVMLETGFGLGHSFLASWAAWRDDPQRAERLVFIGIARHPPSRADLARLHADSPEPRLAAELLQRWPALTPNLHRLSFEQGRLQLLLALGDVRDWLGELVAEVDAFGLDGLAPADGADAVDPHLLKRLARLAAVDATAASGRMLPGLREGLGAAGFAVQLAPGNAGKASLCMAQFKPRHLMQRPAGRLALAPGARQVLVIGAGLAGAACAHALREQGMDCRVLEAAGAAAQGASGNPGGLFHGTLNPDDGLHARFNRAAALETARVLETLGPGLPWLQRGLLRLETRRSLDEMQAQIARLGLPPDYVQALDSRAAAALSGLPLQTAAWFYPGGGALPPAAYARALIGDAVLQTGERVASLRQTLSRWQALDAQGRLIAQADAVVLAGGHETAALLAGLPAEITPMQTWPLLRQRGQISHVGAAAGWPVPRLPVAGAGYAIADGQGGLWCGATAQDEDSDPTLRAQDHELNTTQYRALAAVPPALPQPPLAGRVGWRLLSPDRLPVVGGLLLPGYSGRSDQARLLPRLPGLAVCTALGSRGISWAALCGQLLACRLSGSAMPLEASLLDALDPLR